MLRIGECGSLLIMRIRPTAIPMAAFDGRMATDRVVVSSLSTVVGPAILASNTSLSHSMRLMPSYFNPIFSIVICRGVGVESRLIVPNLIKFSESCIFAPSLSAIFSRLSIAMA